MAQKLIYAMTEASSEHTSRQSVNSPSRLNTTNATTSKTFSSTITAAAIKRYIHQSTHDTSSRAVGFPPCDVVPRTRPVARSMQDQPDPGRLVARPSWIRPLGRYDLCVD